jgi:acyl dehydratase
VTSPPAPEGKRCRPVTRWVVHGVLVVALVAGVFGLLPRATAVIAVLGYRVVNYWLPLLPGALAYLRLRLSLNAAGKARPSTPPAG